MHNDLIDQMESEWFVPPECKYCGCEIMSLDPTATYHQECKQDRDYIMGVYLRDHTIEEWHELENDLDAMIEFLESLLTETKDGE